MTFLIVLFALGVEFTLFSIADRRQLPIIGQWARWCDKFGNRAARWPGYVAASVILLLPVLSTWWLFSWLDDWSSLASNLVAFALLLFMLGPDDLTKALAEHKNELALNPDHGANMALFALDTEKINLGPDSGDAEFDRYRSELAGLAVVADRAWFQPIAWFFIGGPALLVLYRIAETLERDEIVAGETAKVVQRLLQAMEYLPSRVTALALGLVGTLPPVISCLTSIGWLSFGVSRLLIAQSALAAIDNGRISELITGDARIYRLNQMHDLLKRGLVVWLLLIACLSVMGF